MARRDIFKISITNWDKYNSNRKKSYRSVMISERFLDDAKILSLAPCEKLLFLMCILHAAQSERGEVLLSTDMIRTCTRLRTTMIPTSFSQLQSLQLLTYEKIDSLSKRNEMNRNEMKRIPTRCRTPSPAAKISSPANLKTWAAYAAAYQERYKVDPVRNAKVNCAIAGFVKRVGEEQAPEVAKFFVWHNDSFYLRSTHSFSLALRDAESLHTQWVKGQAITMSDVRDFEKQIAASASVDSASEVGNIMTAVRHFGHTNQTDAKAWLGESRWGWVQDLGGWRDVCALPDNDFSRRKIENLIKKTGGIRE